jgi:hypothetical protein
MEARERRYLIDRYRDGARAVNEAVAALSVADFDRLGVGEWSVQQVVHHIADADLVEGVRLRRILAETDAVLPWVDEAGHAAGQPNCERPIETSVGVFTAVVASNAGLLDSLSETDWQRTGRHRHGSMLSVEDWLRKMSAHAHDHAAQMLRAAGRDVI